MKRGQVTTFIIVGIIVLAAVVMTVYVNREYVRSIFEQMQSKLAQAPMNIKPVEDHIKFCLEDTASLSEKIILLQGGYFEPKDYIEMESYDVAYWYDKKDVSPDLVLIGDEIAKSASYLLPGCIIDLEEDYQVEVKSVNPKVIIKNDKIDVLSEINLIVNYKNLSYSLNKDYSVSYNSEIKNLYSAAKEIVASEKVNPDNLDLTLLASTGYDINFFRFNETIVYTISGEELSLMFANKF